MRVFLALLGFTALGLSALAKHGPTTKLHSRFSYTLITADIQCWRAGLCQGRIPTDEKGVMAQELDKLLANAHQSVEVAIYGVRHQSWFFHRLKELADRGVKVQAVVDQEHGKLGEWNVSNNFTYSDTGLLPKYIGLNNVMIDIWESNGYARPSIMHNKFIVIDSKTVWFGSANISDTDIGTSYNANNALIVNSTAIAKLYSNEFKQMFADKKFSTAKKPRLNQVGYEFKDKTVVSVYFSPQDRPKQAIIDFIKNAKKTLDIAMFYLTDEEITSSLIKAQASGVKVRIIYDALAASHESSQHLLLREHGIELKVENWGGKMHMKTSIADGKHVIIGSMNWSVAGYASNDENTMIVTNNPALAQEMATYFEDLWIDIPENSAGDPNNDPKAEGLLSINSCVDNLDNDYDSYKDSRDPSCQ